MTTTPVKLSFEDYQNYHDGTDNYYELEDGELIMMNPPTGHHALIIYYLSNIFIQEISRLNLPWLALQNIGVRTAVNRCRLPDLSVVNSAEIASRLGSSAIIDTGVKIAVEVVSPESQIRDYRYKRAEYNTVGIPEYWVIDILAKKITIFSLIDGLYEGTEYQGETKIISQVLPDLVLTTEQILRV
jgi:Uma2 family endonuclease